MTDLKKCDFCGAVIKPENSFSFALYDDKGVTQDEGDLCKQSYILLTALIAKFKKTQAKAGSC